MQRLHRLYALQCTPSTAVLWCANGLRTGLRAAGAGVSAKLHGRGRGAASARRGAPGGLCVFGDFGEEEEEEGVVLGAERVDAARVVARVEGGDLHLVEVVDVAVLGILRIDLRLLGELDLSEGNVVDLVFVSLEREGDDVLGEDHSAPLPDPTRDRSCQNMKHNQNGLWSSPI